MSKIRIYELAKELGVANKELVEKINSIGSHIKTTISLHSKGRQSFAVEGLSKSFEE